MDLMKKWVDNRTCRGYEYCIARITSTDNRSS
jgi:hypothetical protein